MKVLVETNVILTSNATARTSWQIPCVSFNAVKLGGWRAASPLFLFPTLSISCVKSWIRSEEIARTSLSVLSL